MLDLDEILRILDQCAGSYTFPMWDNGYIYPAATRLSLYCAPVDWAIVIEVFGFSPRAGLPDTTIYTFGSRLSGRNPRENYVSEEAFQNYLRINPNNESSCVFPLDEGTWIDDQDCELVAADAIEISVRGNALVLPPPEAYQTFGIQLESEPRIQVFELCRYLAETNRKDVLATPEERRINVPSNLDQIMQLEEWLHPNLVEEELPSDTDTFKQLAQVLVTGDTGLYRPTTPPNTHWSNWPEGGRL